MIICFYMSKDFVLKISFLIVILAIIATSALLYKKSSLFFSPGFVKENCREGKTMARYRIVKDSRDLYGSILVGGIVNPVTLYNEIGEEVGYIYPSDVGGIADDCQVEGKSICPDFDESICGR